MNRAAEVSAKLEQLDVAEGMKLIESCTHESLYFDVIEDAMCIMHTDGSVNIVESFGKGGINVEVISSATIVRVLQYYRPFKDLFKDTIQ